MSVLEEKQHKEKITRRVSLGFILFSVYLGFVFFEPQQFFGAMKEVRITYALAIFVLSWLFLFAPADLKRRLVGSKIFKLMVLFIGLCVLSVLLSEFPFEKQFNELFKVLSIFLMVALIIRDRSDLTKFFWLLIIFVTVDTTVSILFYHAGLLPTRISSYFGGLGASGSNEFGLLMVQMLPFPLVMLHQKRSTVKRGFLIFSLMTYLYCLTRTQSRSTFLGALLVLSVMVLRKYVPGKYLLGMVLLIAVLLFKTPTSYFERMGTIGEESTITKDSNVVSRIDTYANAVKIIKEHPFLGIGLENYSKYVWRHLYREGDRIFVIHNTYLQIGAEVGVPALVLFLLMIYDIVKNLRVSKREVSDRGYDFYFEDAFSASILGYCIVSLFQPVLYSRILYMVMGSTVCLREQTE